MHFRLELAARNTVEQLLEAGRVESVRELRVRVDELEGVDGAGRDIAVVAMAGNSGLVSGISVIAFGSKLDTSAGAVKVLVIRLVRVRARVEPSGHLAVVLHEGEGAAGRTKSHCALLRGPAKPRRPRELQGWLRRKRQVQRGRR